MAQPIKRVGTYMYQLDDERKGNLWGGGLHAQNMHPEEHAVKAAKLFAAAEGLLAAVKEAADAFEAACYGGGVDHYAMAIDMRAAIAKADQG